MWVRLPPRAPKMETLLDVLFLCPRAKQLLVLRVGVEKAKHIATSLEPAERRSEM
jgi:hypothetical protein